MKYRVFGDTGVYVSILGYGASPFGDIFGDTDMDDIRNAVSLAISNGINYYDVAPSYGPEGLAEERLGLALKGSRKDVLIATKCGRYDHGTPVNPVFEYDYSYDRVIREIENSLRRLKTDYIDFYQVHELINCDFDILINETLPAMETLKKQGKVRFIGITDISLSKLKATLEESTVKIDSILSFCCYDLINTRLKGYFGNMLKEKGTGLINSSVLHLGMMTPNNRTLHFLRERPDGQALREAILKAHDLCGQHGTDLPSQAVMFAFQYDEPALTLMGMGRTSSVKRNLALYDKEPDWDLVAKIRKLFEGVYNPENKD